MHHLPSQDIEEICITYNVISINPCANNSKPDFIILLNDYLLKENKKQSTLIILTFMMTYIIF